MIFKNILDFSYFSLKLLEIMEDLKPLQNHKTRQKCLNCFIPVLNRFLPTLYSHFKCNNYSQGPRTYCPILAEIGKTYGFLEGVGDT